VDLLEHKSLSIIHELRPLVNKLSVVAQVLTRPSSRLSRLFGRRSLAPSFSSHVIVASITENRLCLSRETVPLATLLRAAIPSTALGIGLAVGLARMSRHLPQPGELPVEKRRALGWQIRQARLAALPGMC
jgi:hypothetical protein